MNIFIFQLWLCSPNIRDNHGDGDDHDDGDDDDDSNGYGDKLVTL